MSLSENFQDFYKSLAYFLSSMEKAQKWWFSSAAPIVLIWTTDRFSVQGRIRKKNTEEINDINIGLEMIRNEQQHNFPNETYNTDSLELVDLVYYSDTDSRVLCKYFIAVSGEKCCALQY